MSKKRKKAADSSPDFAAEQTAAAASADDAAAADADALEARGEEPSAAREEPAGATPDARQVELDALRTQLAEQQDRFLRLAADLDNLRKRSRREVADARRFAQADLLRPLLEVLDNFDRALQHAGQDAAADAGVADPVATGDAAGDPPRDAAARGDAFQQGVVLIAQRFWQVLQDCGVRRIEAVGQPFDPAVHEAVGQAPAGGEAAAGTVLAELQAGYTFDDLVLRASRVIVAQ